MDLKKLPPELADLVANADINDIHARYTSIIGEDGSSPFVSVVAAREDKELVALVFTSQHEVMQHVSAILSASDQIFGDEDPPATDA